MSDRTMRSGELVATYAVEAAERLSTIEQDLIALEQAAGQDERDGFLSDLRRETHTLKGAARAADLGDLAALAHELEERINDLPRPGPPDSEHIEACYRCVDDIRRGVSGLAGAGREAPEQAAADPGQAAADPGQAAADPARTRTPAQPAPVQQAQEQAQLAPASEQTAVASDVPRAVFPAGTEEESVRVATRKLDALTHHVGELLATRLTLETLSDELQTLVPKLHRTQAEHGLTGSIGRVQQGIAAQLRSVERISAELRDDVYATRLVPFASIFAGLPRVVRDLAHQQGKQVRLVSEGADVEVDRAVLEALNGPLLHLVRNCVQHGIETGDVRRAMGKEPVGTILVTARQTGSVVELGVTDDGAGISASTLRRVASDRGFLTRQEAESAPETALFDLVFRSGFSTSPVVTELAGRGVGLDVVRHAMHTMQGSAAFDTVEGRKTSFRLRVPVSIATRTCLLVRDAGSLYALPVSAVEAVVNVADEGSGHLGGAPVVTVRGAALPLRRLAAELGRPVIAPEEGVGRGVVGRSLTRQVVFTVDEFVGIRDLVTQALPWPLRPGRSITGVGVLATGEAVPVLSVSSLVDEQATDVPARAHKDTAQDAGASAGASSGASSDQDEAQVTAPLVLVAEDSLTTRTLERNILEAAGYRVRTAADGTAALEAVRAGDVALVVADVLMPGLDGLDLTARIRKDPHLHDIPVIIVSSLGGDDDRRRGIDVGADAYVVKEGFDQQEFLDIVRRLV